MIDIAAYPEKDGGGMHAPDQLDFARRRRPAFEVGIAEIEARFANDRKQQLLVHAREKFLRKGRIAQRRVPEAAIPARAVYMREIAGVEIGDALAQRAAAVRQHLAPSRVPMGELNLFANARDEIGARAEIAVHERLRDAHPIRERLDRDAHALFRENIEGRVEQLAPALRGRKIALATALGPRGPLGGIV